MNKYSSLCWRIGAYAIPDIIVKTKHFHVSDANTMASKRSSLTVGLNLNLNVLASLSGKHIDHLHNH